MPGHWRPQVVTWLHRRNVCDLERALIEPAKGLWTETGATFFRSLIYQLSKALRADLVWMGTLEPGEERVCTIAAAPAKWNFPTLNTRFWALGEKTFNTDHGAARRESTRYFPAIRGWRNCAPRDTLVRRLWTLAAVAALNCRRRAPAF